MFRRIIELAHDADALVPLMLGIAVSVLAIFDVATPRIVDNSILIVLAVLSFALLRDRWIKDSTTTEAREAARAALRKLESIERTTSPLDALKQTVDHVKVTVEGLATIKTLTGADVDLAHEEARAHTDRWAFKGGTGTYTRAMTLPLCIEYARRERRALQVRLEVLDPTNVALCERYARYRVSRSPGPDGTGEPWTTDRTQKESFATLLAAAWYQQNYQLLDIAVGLASSMSSFRFDLSASRIIITQEDPRFPAIVVFNDSPIYESYATELRVSLSQAIPVPLERANVLFGEQPTVPQVREFFTALELPLPHNYLDNDILQIIEKALRPHNPYGRASYEPTAGSSAPSPAAGSDGHRAGHT